MAEQLLNEAVEFYNQGDLENSLKKFEQALKETPKEIHPGIHANVGAVLLGMGELHSAVAAFDEAIALDPVHLEANINKGIACSALEDFTKALTCYEKICEVQPNFFQAQCGRSEALSNLLRFDEAIEAAEKAIDIDPENPLAYADRAFALLKSRRFAEANATYEEAIVCGDDTEETKRLFSISLAQEAYEKENLGERDIALELLHRANELNPTAQNLHNEAIILLTWGRLDEGIQVLLKSVAIDDSYFDSHSALGTVYAQQSLLDEALKHLLRACELDGRAIEPRFNLGVVRIRQFDVPGARSEWLRVLDIEPGEPHATEALRLLDLALENAKSKGIDEKTALREASKQIENLNPNISSQDLSQASLVVDKEGDVMGMKPDEIDAVLENLENLEVNDPSRLLPSPQNEEEGEIAKENSLSGNSIKTSNKELNNLLEKAQNAAESALKLAEDAKKYGTAPTAGASPEAKRAADNAVEASAASANYAQVLSANAAKQNNPKDAIALAMQAGRCAAAAAESAEVAALCDPIVADAANASATTAGLAANKSVLTTKKNMEGAPTDINILGKQAVDENKQAVHNCNQAMMNTAL